MADTRPTPINLLRAIKLCIQVVFSPGAMEEEERKDDEFREKFMPPAPSTRPHRAFAVRQAFFTSFKLVLTSAAVGYIAGYSTGNFEICASSRTVSWLQIAGTSLLLWGTLFIRGWDIQTYSGVTLTERVNQWIYRTLYCVGTAVIVYSLALPACKL